MTVTNISCYKFARLSGLKPLRERLIERCREAALKGTILLSTEGINLFVAGDAEGIDALIGDLRAIPGLEDLTPKVSLSAHQPFSRMLVRIKKEIIAFGVEGIDPASRTSPKLPARTLKQWLDEGRPVTLLDTRNDYEVKLGTFRNAMTLDIDHFRQFPAAVQGLPPELKHAPVVMFCTGGIRCEKAGPYMEREGFENIYQLDGGILKYFEECGGAHYDGECFVFDQRVGVDPALQESGSEQCYVCQAPLTPMEQRDERYVPGKSCPYCFRDPAGDRVLRMAARQEALIAMASPLPGSAPYENRRPMRIPANFDGAQLVEFLTAAFPRNDRAGWEEQCAAARFLDGSGTVADAQRLIRSGDRFFYLTPENVEPDVNPSIRLLHEDDAIIVVDKPAPLPVHPSGRFNRNTLQYFINSVFAPLRPRPAHRLDANTTGVLVLATTKHFARLIQPQFERGGVEKVYLARVQGHPPEDTFECHARVSAEPGPLGSRTVDATAGLPAETQFRVLRRDPDGSAFIEARPITGRTNQIRVHLWHLGWPVLGDPAYLTNRRIGSVMTCEVGAPPVCLHAWCVTITHPMSGERVTFSAEPPGWAPAGWPQSLSEMPAGKSA